MIKFFRRIRKKLLSEGKIGDYFKYAFGEIILVVIGILIALQINNWNEKIKVTQKTDSYLDALNTEIETNINTLDYHKIKFHKDIETHSETLTYLHSENSISTNDSLFAIAIETDPIFKPTLTISTFTDLINSGYLENVTEIDLKNRILAIEAGIEEVYEKHGQAKDIWENFQNPYLMKYSNVSGNWDSISGIKIQELPYKIQVDAFVNNKEYADILVLRMRMVANLEAGLIELKDDFTALSNDIKIHLGLKPENDEAN